MQTTQTSVFIPLVELSDENSQLLEVYAVNQRFGATESDDQAIDRNYNITAFPLNDVGLFSVGTDVVKKLCKLTLKPPRWSIYQYFNKNAWIEQQRLNTGSANFTNCEGSSAELGLVIALLLNGSNTPFRYAIATGNLKGENRKNNDLAIGAVGSVPEKLDLIIQKRKNGALPDGHLFCFTPIHYTKEGELHEVAKLTQIEELAQLNIDVKPIEWLSDAQKILKADTTKYLTKEKQRMGVLAVLACLALIFTLYLSWLNNPIPIDILLPPNLQADNNKNEPFLICAGRNKTDGKFEPLKRDGEIPIVPLFAKENIKYNNSVGLYFQILQTIFSDGYYVLPVFLGELTGYQPHPVIEVSAKEILKKQWFFKENPEKKELQRLILLINRTSIDANELHQQFNEQFPRSKTPLKLQEATDFLTEKFPGHYYFTYKSIPVDESPCSNI